ncbi:uncharacterized protein LOC119650991 [Hermetia illucens]|uniref:uncharacterized protein LOC119650991 n=1 Tax=Hermetia illucens TaxID=343691 RepID=UPI0018CC52E8|nr:uncharacterized protein LOC119650991 [Hermetia illucens]
MVERLHRQLKAAIRCHANDSWTRVLPTVLLGIRAAWCEDLLATSAELVYGTTLRLPGEFWSDTTDATTDQTAFITEFRRHFDKLRPVQTVRHGYRTPFIFKDLETATHVFVRHDAVKSALKMPYDGPYTVVRRKDKNFVVKIRGRDVTVSIDRLKPAYIFAEGSGDQGFALNLPATVQPAVEQPQAPPPAIDETPPQGQDQQRNPVNDDLPNEPRRSGRRVRFVDRYQAGYS